MNQKHLTLFKLFTYLYSPILTEAVFLKPLEFYLAVCCLHSHLLLNFLCNTKEFLILVLFHRRE